MVLGAHTHPKIINGMPQIVSDIRLAVGLVELLPGRHVLEVLYFSGEPSIAMTFTKEPVRLAYEFAAGHSYALKYGLGASYPYAPVQFWIEDVTGNPKWTERIQVTREDAMKDPNRKFRVPEDGRP